ncbi:MAG: FG-GAP-like repeat-containing protein [Flavobacteriales bacterium]
MMKQYATGALALALATGAVAQPVFTNASAALSHSASSGGCMAVTDMDGDGLDDIVQLDQSSHVYVLYQNANGTFTTFDYGSVGDEQWGWAIADLDNNGHKDIVSGGFYDGTHYIRITSRGVYTLSQLDGPDIYTQCMSIGDVDNDGRADVLACNDDGPPNLWFTNASGTPVNNNAYIDWATICTDLAGDMSGNYGSTFTDFDNDGDLDLYISHCRQGVNQSTDCRRWNRLFVNDGTDHYSDLAADHGLENRSQSWTSDFGDYDNDGDLDVVTTNHDNTLMLFENDGTGHYTEVTAGSGLEVSGFFLQGLFRDLDNDGHLDILVAGGIHAFFKGNGDGTFTRYNNVFPANRTMHGFAFGDLNNDGFEDVYANYGKDYVGVDNNFPDRLWLNTPNGNHWFNVQLEGVQSNRDAVGAKVIITGPWGTQVREVHAGESYGLVNSFTCHFGLGASDRVQHLTVRWPSGLEETFDDLAANQTVTVKEGVCISSNAAITLDGPAVVCTGGNALTLSANTGFENYRWNTGATTEAISVSQGGTYWVIMESSGGCPGQASIAVAQDPDETPTITASSDLTICSGDQLTLTSSATGGNTWSDGSTGQQLVVSTAGTYSVQHQGTCASFTSSPVTVEVLSAPDAPVSSDVSIPVNATAALTAAGDSIVWYDAATGGNVVGTGNTYTTPALSATRSYWCAGVEQHGGEQAHGGKTARSTSTGQYANNNTFYLLFTANEDLLLKSVKVYANGAASRTIALVDGSDNSIITSGTFQVPDGESRVQLGFHVPAGGPYGLRITSNNPQLWRDGQGSTIAFPYPLGTLGSILSTSATGPSATAFYYFFYDWEVEGTSTYCTGPRTEVVVYVGSTGIDGSAASALAVYPNPATGLLNIDLGALTGPVDLDLLDITGRAVISRRVPAANGIETLGLEGIAAGGYGLRIRSNAGTVIRRVVVR